MFETNRVLIAAYLSGHSASLDVTVYISGVEGAQISASSTDVATAALLVKRSGSPTDPCSVNWTLSGSMAAEDYSDDQLLSDTLTFPSGVSQRTIPISIKAHAIGTANKTIKLTLSSPAGCTISGSSTATATVIMPSYTDFSASNESVNVVKSNIIVIDAMANDTVPSGTVIYSLGNPSPNVGSATITNSGTRITYYAPGTVPASIVTLPYTLRAPDGRTKSANVFITVKNAAVAGDERNYAWKFPNPGAVVSSKCKVWRHGSNVPSHSVGDILIYVADDVEIQDDFNMNGFGAIKGPLAPIGLSMRPRGWLRGTGHTVAQPFLGTRAIFKITFDPSAKSHAAWQDEAGGPDRDWPFLYMCNVDINYQTNGCAFGDILRFGQGGYLENDRTSPFAFNGPKAALFMNKVRLIRGPHYSSDILDAGTTVDGKAISSSENGHSDFIQSFAGAPVWRISDVQLDWFMGQAFFSGREADDCGWPRTTRWRLKNVAMDHSDRWIDYAPHSGGLGLQPQFIKATEEQATGGSDNSGENYDYGTGKYMAVDMESCYLRGKYAKTLWSQKVGTTNTGVGAYILGKGGITSGLDANQYFRFLSTKPSGAVVNTFPAYTGTCRYLTPDQALPETCPSNHAGRSLRLAGTDADIISQFISIIQA